MVKIKEKRHETSLHDVVHMVVSILEDDQCRDLIELGVSWIPFFESGEAKGVELSGTELEAFLKICGFIYTYPKDDPACKPNGSSASTVPLDPLMLQEVIIPTSEDSFKAQIQRSTDFVSKFELDNLVENMKDRDEKIVFLEERLECIRLANIDLETSKENLENYLNETKQNFNSAEIDLVDKSSKIDNLEASIIEKTNAIDCLKNEIDILHEISNSKEYKITNQIGEIEEIRNDALSIWKMIKNMIPYNPTLIESMDSNCEFDLKVLLEQLPFCISHFQDTNSEVENLKSLLERKEEEIIEEKAKSFKLEQQLVDCQTSLDNSTETLDQMTISLQSILNIEKIEVETQTPNFDYLVPVSKLIEAQECISSLSRNIDEQSKSLLFILEEKQIVQNELKTLQHNLLSKTNHELSQDTQTDNIIFNHASTSIHASDFKSIHYAMNTQTDSYYLKDASQSMTPLRTFDVAVGCQTPRTLESDSIALSDALSIHSVSNRDFASSNQQQNVYSKLYDNDEMKEDDDVRTKTIRNKNYSSRTGSSSSRCAPWMRRASVNDHQSIDEDYSQQKDFNIVLKDKTIGSKTVDDWGQENQPHTVAPTRTSSVSYRRLHDQRQIQQNCSSPISNIANSPDARLEHNSLPTMDFNDKLFHADNLFRVESVEDCTYEGGRNSLIMPKEEFDQQVSSQVVNRLVNTMALVKSNSLTRLRTDDLGNINKNKQVDAHFRSELHSSTSASSAQVEPLRQHQEYPQEFQNNDQHSYYTRHLGQYSNRSVKESTMSIKGKGSSRELNNVHLDDDCDSINIRYHDDDDDDEDDDKLLLDLQMNKKDPNPSFLSDKHINKDNFDERSSLINKNQQHNFVKIFTPTRDSLAGRFRRQFDSGTRLTTASSSSSTINKHTHYRKEVGLSSPPVCVGVGALKKWLGENTT